MNYETATNDDLEVKLGELLGMGRFAALTAPRYCTDWNATMPLAVKYGVTPVLDDGYGYATTNPYEIYDPQGLGESDGFFAVEMDHDTTPLRSIVTCLIKALESKNDSGQK